MAEKQRRMRLRDDVRLIESIHKKTQEREHAHVLRARTSKDRQLLDELQTCVTQIADALFAGEVTLDNTEGLKIVKRLESDRAFINDLTDIQLLDPEAVKRVRIVLPFIDVNLFAFLVCFAHSTVPLRSFTMRTDFSRSTGP